MHCPYCQCPVCEESPACPRCGLDMDKANSFFGTVPRLGRGVNDTGGLLSASEVRAIRRAIRSFEDRFPQTGFTVAFMALPRNTPGATYAWWLFNRSLAAGERQPAGTNRHLFLLVDTAGSGAWLTGGYGLEPFVSASQLQQCLEAAHVWLARGNLAAGVSALLKETETVLRQVVSTLPRAFGLTPAFFQSAASPATTS